MNDFELLKAWIITSSVGTSAVRNQGNGIAQPIRDKLIAELEVKKFVDRLRNKNSGSFITYLDKLTDALTGLKGISNNDKPPGRVHWGTARKCVNMVLRSTVYNAFIYEKYGFANQDFHVSGIMNKLELPLDSYVVKGIKEDCKKYRVEFDRKAYGHFSVKNLDRHAESAYYQKKAAKIAEIKNVCRIHLDITYWRKLGIDKETDEAN